MSVSRSGSRDGFHYDDFYQQQVAVELLVPNNTDDEKLILEGEFSFDPADGVSRGEVYELAAVESMWRLAPPDTVNDMSNMAYRSELGFSPKLVNKIDSLGPDSRTYTASGGSSRDVNVLGDPDGSSNDDLIWWTNDRAETGFQDSTNGPGGNATNSDMNYWFMNFYDQFGSGPRVDRHDLLYWNLVTNERFTEGNYAFHQHFRFWWDMVAEDDSVRSR